MEKKCSWCNEIIGDEYWFHNVKVNGRTKKSEEKFCSPKCSYEYPYQATPEKGCFVATAVYGNYDHPIVMDLRFFRDNYLEQKKWGQSIIRFYYKYSPFFAKWIEKSESIKSITRSIFISPIHFLVKLFLKQKRWK